MNFSLILLNPLFLENKINHQQNSLTKEKISKKSVLQNQLETQGIENRLIIKPSEISSDLKDEIKIENECITEYNFPDLQKIIDLTSEDHSDRTIENHTKITHFGIENHTSHYFPESRNIIKDDIKIGTETLTQYTFPNLPVNLQQIIDAANTTASKEPKKFKTRETITTPSYKCEICNEVLPTLYSLNKHRQRKHNPDGSKRQYSCRLCSQAFETDILLQQHVGSHHSNLSIVCQQCNYHAFSKSDLWMHMDKQHGVEIGRVYKRFRCTYCSNGFSKLERLKSHINLQHIKQFPCEDCGHIITSKHVYYRHRHKHRNEKYTK